MVVSGFIRHRYVAVWARKYQTFDLAPVSTLLSYMSNVIKGFIQ